VAELRLVRLMIRISIAVASLLGVLFAAAPEHSLEKRDWQALAAMLGEPVTRVSRNIPEIQSARRIADTRRADEYSLHIEGKGMYLVFRDDYFAEVHFQLLNGKKIADVRYSGTLPFGITDHRVTPEEIIARIGQPVKQEERAWKRLTYQLDAFLVTLYFASDQLEGISVARK
jgi:hypothetical protein